VHIVQSQNSSLNTWREFEF